jgi:very-short-patch-repair endonuclease
LQVREKANKLRISLTNKARARIIYEISSSNMSQNNPMKRPEVKAKVRAWAEAHPEQMANTMQKLMEGNARLQRDKPSRLEIRLREMLTELGLSFEPSATLKPKFVVDIRIGSLIIEADGDYWHGHPRFAPLTERQQGQQKRDRARDRYLAACGYTVIRIWESDMTRNHLEAVLKEQGLIPG